VHLFTHICCVVLHAERAHRQHGEVDGGAAKGVPCSSVPNRGNGDVLRRPGVEVWRAGEVW
jgi:hypothetical protein